MTTLPVGKVPSDLLKELLTMLPPGQRVVLGPAIGEDAAALAMADRYLVVKTDPITFATDAIGWYAVQVCANDIATTGATPLWFLATILLPPAQATPGLIRSIFDQIGSACQALGVGVVGGHTEITANLDRPIVVGCMLGEVMPNRLIRTGGARPGDMVLLTKGAPIEATAIIAREKRQELLAHFPAHFLDECARFLYDPGISIVRDAQIAIEAGGITSMHDPTEGGLLTALWELAEASGCALEVTLYDSPEPWLPQGKTLCQFFGLDPAAAIASGALLLTVVPERVAALLEAYRQEQLPVFQIGRVIQGNTAVYDRARGLLPRPARDEIARLF
jgi:hydrogenase maturation factor